MKTAGKWRAAGQQHPAAPHRARTDSRCQFSADLSVSHVSCDIEHSSLSINVARLGSSVITVCSLCDRVGRSVHCEAERKCRRRRSEFELCFLDAGGTERRELLASWPGLQPELFLPVREFLWARGQRHLPGLWWSATAGAHVGYESWLERDLNRTLQRVTKVNRRKSCGAGRPGVSRSQSLMSSPTAFRRFSVRPSLVTSRVSPWLSKKRK
jgi:hypothetical protein